MQKPPEQTTIEELRSGGWRYQPVYVENGDGDRGLTLCEVYFDEDGKLKAWTEDPAMSPGGETVEELYRDITRMLADAYKWQPVVFGALRVGMTFDRTGADVERMIAAVDAARRVQ
jgi:hypothetical protein